MLRLVSSATAASSSSFLVLFVMTPVMMTLLGPRLILAAMDDIVHLILQLLSQVLEEVHNDEGQEHVSLVSFAGDLGYREYEA